MYGDICKRDVPAVAVRRYSNMHAANTAVAATDHDDDDDDAPFMSLAFLHPSKCMSAMVAIQWPSAILDF